jgi:hypothetical protein
MSKVDWPGAIAFTLALGIAISMVVAIVGTVGGGRTLSAGSANVLSTLFGASVGVVGTYLGAHGRHGRRQSDPTSEEKGPHDTDA